MCGLVTLEWILIIGAVAGLAGVAFWLVWSSVSDDAGEVAGSEHYPAALLAASHITADARAALPANVDDSAVERVNTKFGRRCEDLMLAYRDIGLRTRWEAAAPTDTRRMFVGESEPPGRAVCLVSPGEPAPPPVAAQAQAQPAAAPPTPEVYIWRDLEVPEGGFAEFHVRLSDPSGRAVSVDYETNDGTARSESPGKDYEGQAASVTFAPGDQLKRVLVRVVSDADGGEGDETFELCLRAETAAGAQVRPRGEGGCRTATIRDARGVQLPRLTISDVAALEGHPLRFVVSLNMRVPWEVSVHFETVESDGDGAATEGVDYAPRSERVTIRPGSDSVTVRVLSKQDELLELPERFGVLLEDATGATIDVDEATGTIRDDDSANRPVVRIFDAFANEGDKYLTFTLTLSAAVEVPVSVEASTTNGSAEAPDDFVARSREPVLFEPGATSADLKVELVDDTKVEGAQTFGVALAHPRYATITAGDGDRAEGTITDNDSAVPQVLISGVGRVIEGEPVSATVRLSRSPTQTATVNWAASSGTALRGTDFARELPAEGVLTFEPGGPTSQTVQTVQVDTFDDSAVERDETFWITARAVSGASGGARVKATILDNDAVPVASLGPGRVREDEGPLEFPVTLNRVSSRAVSLRWWTEAHPTATHKATPGFDYTPQLAGEVEIAAGEPGTSLAVPITDDDLYEYDEVFRVRLGYPTGGRTANATIGTGLVVGTIIDDDTAPELRIHPATAVESENLSFEVTLSTAAGRVVTAKVSTRDLIGDAAATAGADYVALKGASVEVLAGSTSTTVTVNVINDSETEEDETFLAYLADTDNATLAAGGGRAVGTILDDEKPRLSVANVAVLEGSGDTADFVVTLSRALAEPVTFRYATRAVAEGARSATACDADSAGSEDPVDFVAVTPSTGTISPGETELTVSVTICDDDVVEGDETFSFAVSDIDGALGVDEGSRDTTTATGTVLDDESSPRISVNDPTAAEGDGTIDFEVTLSRAAEADVVVQYATSDGTAKWSGAHPDYVQESGDLLIPAGNTTATIEVELIDDDFAEIRNRGEPDETAAEQFQLRLSLPGADGDAPARLGDREATGTINDDDPFPVVFVYDTNLDEDDGPAIVRVELDRPHNEQITVDYRTAVDQLREWILSDRERCTYRPPENPNRDFEQWHTEDRACPAGLPTEGPGFVETSGTLVFNPGSRVQTFGVEILDNDTPNPRNRHGHPVRIRRLNVVLHGLPAEYCRGDEGWDELPACARVNVRDDEQRPRLHFTQPIVADRLESAGTLDYEIDLGGHTVDFDITVRYTTDPLLNNCLHGYPEATPAEDYPAPVRRTFNVLLCESDGDGGVRRVSNGGLPVTTPVTRWAHDGSVTIPAGQPSATIRIPITDDSVVDAAPVEYLQVRLLSVDDGRADAGISGGIPISRGGIIDDDTPVELSVGSAATAEDAGPMRFRVTLSRPSTDEVRVAYRTADHPGDGAATAGDDYKATSGTLRIPAGDVSAIIEVPLFDDEGDEGDERFELNVTAPAGSAVTVTGSPAVGTILNDDGDGDGGLPVLTVADVAAYEDPFSGTITNGYLVFDLRLSKPNTGPVTVTYGFEEVPSLGEYAALRSLDFRDYYSNRPELQGGRRSDTITIPASDAEGCWSRADDFWAGLRSVPVGTCLHEPLTRRLSLYTVGDNVPERDERLRLWLSDPVGVRLGNVEAWGTILNNDLPIVTIGHVDVSESARRADFTVRLHAPSFGQTTVLYRTAPWIASGVVATDGEDYTATSGTLTIAAGADTATISVPIRDDAVDEYNEFFVLQLYGADGLHLSHGSALGRIIDDDPGWLINDASAGEGDANVTFTIERDQPWQSARNLHYTITDGGAIGGSSCAEAGVDYVRPSGTVPIAAGAGTATVTVVICDDDAIEGGETFTISLSEVVGRRTSATATITDND